jgi:hypothetical protein
MNETSTQSLARRTPANAITLMKAILDFCGGILNSPDLLTAPSTTRYIATARSVAVSSFSSSARTNSRRESGPNLSRRL